MLHNKNTKPNLIDPKISKVLLRTVNNKKIEYWEPTRNFFRTFYDDYIIPNLALVFFIIAIIIFLLYRYRETKNKREEEWQKNNEVDLIFNAYDESKQMSIEPKIDTTKKTDRIKWASNFAYPIYPYFNGSLKHSEKYLNK